MHTGMYIYISLYLTLIRNLPVNYGPKLVRKIGSHSLPFTGVQFLSSWQRTETSDFFETSFYFSAAVSSLQ
jgi:hypothetical protein